MLNVPTGNNKEDIKRREEIISDVYRNWYQSHPSKRVFNDNLKDYINVRYISISETMRHAAKSQASTLAVLQLDAILRCAKRVGKPMLPKKGVKNQKDFVRIILMTHQVVGIGVVKLTVGIKKSGEKVQYCITAIQA